MLIACSSMPPALKNAPAVDVQLNDVRNNANDFKGTPVRWGGTIVEVENEANISRIQILYYPLQSSGRPMTESNTQGRFIIQTQNFLDPAIYKKDADISVTGLLNGTVHRTIGKRQLLLPVINAENIYLWPEARNRNYYAPDCFGYYPPAFYGFSRRYYYPCY
jgi:outer membrane lipoprotein